MHPSETYTMLGGHYARDSGHEVKSSKMHIPSYRMESFGKSTNRTSIMLVQQTFVLQQPSVSQRMCTRGIC